MSKGAPKAPPMQPPPKDVTDREISTPPLSPVKILWDDGLQARLLTNPSGTACPPTPKGHHAAVMSHEEICLLYSTSQLDVTAVSRLCSGAQLACKVHQHL